MDASAYDETLRLLTEKGFPIRESRYDVHVFASWWIELATVPGVRLIWDGKDRLAIVQTAATQRQPPWDKDKWEDRWIGRGREEQTPVELVRYASQFVGTSDSNIE